MTFRPDFYVEILRYTTSVAGFFTTADVQSADVRGKYTPGDRKTLVIQNGTPIDGSGAPASETGAVVIDENRITSQGSTNAVVKAGTISSYHSPRSTANPLCHNTASR